MNWHSNTEKPENFCRCIAICISDNNDELIVFNTSYDASRDTFVVQQPIPMDVSRRHVIAWVEHKKILRDLRCFLHFGNWQPLEYYDGLLNNKELWK